MRDLIALSRFVFWSTVQMGFDSLARRISPVPPDTHVSPHCHECRGTGNRPMRDEDGEPYWQPCPCPDFDADEAAHFAAEWSSDDVLDALRGVAA